MRRCPWLWFAIVWPLAARAATIENHSRTTTCAEVDNVDIGVFATNHVSAYRITATHPAYFPTTIDERGPDFSNCAFVNRVIWQVGLEDGDYDEFNPSGFSSGDIHFAADDPPAGIDETASVFPREINNDWMTNQLIRFTAAESDEPGTERAIGAQLLVAMALVNGTVEVRAETWTGAAWSNHGSRIFTSAARTNTWDIPDFTWLAGADANVVHLDVITSGEGGASTPGAWAYYDYVQLKKRDEAGETVLPVLFDNGTTKVEVVHIDFWWRAPEAMTVSVDGGGSSTNAHYLRIIRKLPDAAGYAEVFVLYEDGNARIIPLPPAGLSSVPYGASVILGASSNAARPYAAIEAVDVDPTNLTLDIQYVNGGSATVALNVDRTQHVVDVSAITYPQTHHAFARVRSMWVYDGKADADRVENGEGVFPILDLWTHLEGPWWRFFRDVPSYHNTYAPDFRIELPSGAQSTSAWPDVTFMTRQGESLDAGTNHVLATRPSSVGGQTVAVSNPAQFARFTYDILLTSSWYAAYAVTRYADDVGPNRVEIAVDGVARGQFPTETTDEWFNFTNSSAVYLGPLTAGAHEFEFRVEAATFGIDIDQFELRGPPRDSDGDGLFDGWELIHFAALARDAAGDADDDGADNFNEYVAGTQPTNDASLFEVAASSVTNRGITITTEPGRNYAIYFLDGSLSNNATWAPFANTINGIGTWLETNPVSATHTFYDDESANTTVAPPAGGQRSYRVTVSSP